MTSKKLSLENNGAGNNENMKSIPSGGAPGKERRQAGTGFFELCAESIRRNLWLPLLGAIVMLFSYPVNMGMQMSYYAGKVNNAVLSGNIKRAEELRETMGESANLLLTGEYSFLWLTVFVAAVLCAIGMFGWQYNKRQVDFYNSRPVTRTKSFFASYTAGAVVMLACLLFGLVSSFAIAAAYGAEPLLVKEMILSNIGYMIMFMFIYSTAVFAVTVTGNKFSFFMVYLWICILAYVIRSVIYSFEIIYFETTVGYNDSMRMIMNFSPITWLSDFYKGLSEILYNPIAGGEALRVPETVFTGLKTCIAVSAIFAVVITLLSWLLYKKRDSESAEKALSFKASKRPVRIVLTVVLALVSSLAGTLFEGDGGAMTFWTVFFTAAGAAFFHGVIEAVYYKDIKAILKDKAELLACIAVSLLITGGFKYDIFGYDSYVPEAKEVAEISVISTDFLPSKYETVRAKEVYYSDDHDYDYRSEGVKIRDEEEIESILSLIKTSYEITGEDGNNENDVNETSYYDESSNGEAFAQGGHYMMFETEMKSGRKYTRHYTIPAESIKEYFAPILETQAHRKEIFPILNIETEDMGILGINLDDPSKFDPENELDRYDYSGYSMSENISAGKGREAAEEIFDAFKEDLSNSDFEDIVEMNYWGDDDRYEEILYVPLECVLNSETEFKNSGAHPDKGPRYDTIEGYPILESFENTKAALQKYGY